jgi:prevent-host-death family protein
MKTASVTELKANLSRYLRMVRRGSEVQILERGVPIARLTSLQAKLGQREHGADAARLERLTAAGVVRGGKANVAWAGKEKPIKAARAALSSALLEDRDDRI